MARQAIRVRGRRSAGDVLAGLSATVALAALVAGVPFALLTFYGSPIPDELPTASDLTQRVGQSSIIAVLVALVWLAWLQLVVCVAVEVYAGIRGIGVPTRVPLAGGTQSLVHRLVVAALLLFTATSAIVPAFAGRELFSVRPQHTQSQEHHRAPPPPEAGSREPARMAPAAAAEPVHKPSTIKIYRVQPPHGRHHESLWEIADKCLGDGRRYKEIYELNKGRQQPDGTRLTIASLIRPGWVLEMPPDAVGAQLIRAHDLDDYQRHGENRPEPPGRSTAPQPPPELGGDAGTGGAQVPGRQRGQEPPRPTLTPGAPGTQAPREREKAQDPPHKSAPAPETTPERAPERRTPAADSDRVPIAHDIGWPEGLAAAGLLAAGLLAGLGRRRRAQMWHRAFGRMIARPEGAAATAEHALRVGADPEAARLLDLGLRQMSKALAADGRTLPTVYGVHLGAESLDLWIAPADRTPPAPWESYDEGQVWRLTSAALPGLAAADLGDVLAPYPGLVSIGTNDTGRILVDLEAAHGLIALAGPAEIGRAVLAGIALELATNRWSDHMRITLVGFGDELALVAPDRIRAVDALAEALPELEARGEEVRQALAASGADSVLTGRCRGVFGEAWMPHYLIMADEPTEREADRLVALARTGQRMAAGHLVPGEVPGATWTWEVTAGGRLHAGVLGFEAIAQQVPEDDYRAVVDLFRTAGKPEGPALAELADEPAGDVQQAAADIRILGPIEIDAPGPMDESRRALCTEVLVYLATHPGGVHPTVLGGAVWPRGVTSSVRDATIARVSDWLGLDARGRPNLYYDDRGRIRLGSEVRVDWAVFRWLVWRSAAEPASEAAYMSYALDLIRGPLLADRPRGRYGWLAADDLEYEATARVIDVAHRLVLMRLDEDDARGAAAAAGTGLRLAPDDEGLWRDLLRATHATGDGTQVRTIVERLRSRVGRDPMQDQMQPETEALVEELLPHWRQVPARP